MFLQPYYRPRPKGAMKVDGKPSRTSAAKSKVSDFKVVGVSEPLTGAIKRSQKPSLNSVWCYHDQKIHQNFAHLAAGAGFKYRKRNDAARKKFVPLVRPKNVQVFDKTHTIPFGYHGLEDDARLVVGWDSRQNQKEFSSFESRQKSRQHDIYWLTHIERTGREVTWLYRVYDARNGKCIDGLEMNMKCAFHWEG
jgi:hypothetical protein